MKRIDIEFNELGETKEIHSFAYLFVKHFKMPICVRDYSRCRDTKVSRQINEQKTRCLSSKHMYVERGEVN